MDPILQDQAVQETGATVQEEVVPNQVPTREAVAPDQEVSQVAVVRREAIHPEDLLQAQAGAVVAADLHREAVDQKEAVTSSKKNFRK